MFPKELQVHEFNPACKMEDDSISILSQANNNKDLFIKKNHGRCKGGKMLINNNNCQTNRQFSHIIYKKV